MEFILLNKLSQETGYTVAALRQKIQRGDWINNLHYIRSPDGRIHVNLKEYHKWVNGEKPELQRVAKKA